MKGPKLVRAASAETNAMAVIPSPSPPHSFGMWGSQTFHSCAFWRSSMIMRTMSERSGSPFGALA